MLILQLFLSNHPLRMFDCRSVLSSSDSIYLAKQIDYLSSSSDVHLKPLDFFLTVDRCVGVQVIVDTKEWTHSAIATAAGCSCYLLLVDDTSG